MSARKSYEIFVNYTSTSSPSTCFERPDGGSVIVITASCKIQFMYCKWYNQNQLYEANINQLSASVALV